MNLGCKLVALARGALDVDREPTGEVARDIAFNPTDIVEIDNGPVTNAWTVGGNQHGSVRRKLDCLAGNFQLIGQHATSKQGHGFGAAEVHW